MKNLKKALVLFLCAVLLVAGSVMGTLAYLTAQASVTNTFTVGDVAITMDETDVDTMGVKDGDTRVTANGYHLLPGHTYVKDPVIHVGAESENCFLFLRVTNDIAGIEDSANNVAAQLAANGWSPVSGETNVYKYQYVCGKGNNIPTFTQFKLADNLTDLSLYKDKTITLVAYAIQADGFGSADAAWTAYKTQELTNP